MSSSWKVLVFLQFLVKIFMCLLFRCLVFLSFFCCDLLFCHNLQKNLVAVESILSFLQDNEGLFPPASYIYKFKDALDNKDFEIPENIWKGYEDLFIKKNGVNKLVRTKKDLKKKLEEVERSVDTWVIIQAPKRKKGVSTSIGQSMGVKNISSKKNILSKKKVATALPSAPLLTALPSAPLLTALPSAPPYPFNEYDNASAPTISREVGYPPPAYSESPRDEFEGSTSLYDLPPRYSLELGS